MEVKDFVIKKLNSDPDFKAKYEDVKNKKYRSNEICNTLQ